MTIFLQTGGGGGRMAPLPPPRIPYLGGEQR